MPNELGDSWFSPKGVLAPWSVRWIGGRATEWGIDGN